MAIRLKAEPTREVSQSNDGAPLVSIGLPVYNGDNYLEEAIASILAQTFTDFELIISDNASTDRTEEIARRFAAADDRIRFHRNETNIGGANNQNLTLDLARGRYVRMAAHDDVMAPTLLEECIKVLESQPEVVLCYPASVIIDADGNRIKERSIGRGTAARPSQRFAELAFRNHACEPIYGLLRGDVLRAVQPMGNYTDSDRVLLCEIAMHGPFVELPSALFYKRYHAKNYYLDWRARMAWYTPARKGRASLPHWLALGNLCRVVRRAPISAGERIRCVGVLVAWTLLYSMKLLKDLMIALRVALKNCLMGQPAKGIYNWE
jgi:glycosyltransferase involved in cell wall biosynthesis